MNIRLRSTSPRRPSMPSLLAVAAICLLCMSSLASHAMADALSVDVKFYSATTGKVITTASAGSRVLVKAVLIVPESAAGAKVSLVTSAKLKLVGVTMPYKIPMATIDASNTNPQDDGTLLQTGTQQGEFKIPSSTPRGSAFVLTAKAMLGSAVSNVVKARLKVL